MLLTARSENDTRHLHSILLERHIVIGRDAHIELYLIGWLGLRPFPSNISKVQHWFPTLTVIKSCYELFKFQLHEICDNLH